MPTLPMNCEVHEPQDYPPPPYICSPLRIVLFLPSLNDGGAERVNLRLAEGLRDRGMEVTLAVSREARSPFYAVPEGIPIANFHSLKMVMCLPKLVRYLRRERPDVLVSSLNYANLLSLITKRIFVPDLKVVVVQHVAMSEQQARERPTLRMAIRVLKRLLPSADAIVAVSQGVGDDLAWAVPSAASLVEVIPNPVVSPALFKQMDEPVDHPWFNDSDTPVILSVGRLSPQKDQATLLRAFALATQTYPCRLVLLGEGPELPRLKRLAHTLGVADRVHFAGFQSNPYAYMAKAQLLVLSSAYEGLPTVLVEAMACGAPVVSTDCPSGPREILADGVLGPLTPPGDWQRLGHAMVQTLRQPMDPQRLKAGVQCYTSEQSVAAYARLLERVARQ